MTRIIVESALVGSAIGLAIALAAFMLGRPLGTLPVGMVAGIGAGGWAAIRAWRHA